MGNHRHRSLVHSLKLRTNRYYSVGVDTGRARGWWRCGVNPMVSLEHGHHNFCLLSVLVYDDGKNIVKEGDEHWYMILVWRGRHCWEVDHAADKKNVEV